MRLAGGGLGELLEALMQQAVLTADDALTGADFQATFAECMQPGYKPPKGGGG